jgi:hypothetical protein
MGLVKDILDILDKNEDWKNMKAATACRCTCP